MKNVYRCAFCMITKESLSSINIHQNECSFNPKNKMNTTIEDARKFLIASGLYEYGTISMSHDALSTLLESYHSYKCQEAGKELLSNDDIKHRIPNSVLDTKFFGAIWFKEEFSKLLASKQSQLEELKQKLQFVDDLILRPELTNDQIHNIAL